MGGQRRWAKRQSLYCSNDPADAFYKITNCFIDYEFDTQRRRGIDAADRESWAI